MNCSGLGKQLNKSDNISMDYFIITMMDVSLEVNGEFLIYFLRFIHFVCVANKKVSGS